MYSVIYTYRLGHLTSASICWVKHWLVHKNMRLAPYSQHASLHGKGALTVTSYTIIWNVESLLMLWSYWNANRMNRNSVKEICYTFNSRCWLVFQSIMENYIFFQSVYNWHRKMIDLLAIFEMLRVFKRICYSYFTSDP